MPTTRRPRAARLLATSTALALVLTLAACSDDSSDGETSVSSWCDSVRDLDAMNSEPGALNDPATLAAFREGFQNLADEAPEEIAPAMKIYVEASLANYDALQSDTTPDPTTMSALVQAGATVDPYLAENCDGFQFGGSSEVEE
jgi:hypothetical protein